MIAAHLGIVEEDKINDMSYIFFEDVLTELGYKLTYDAIANYAGNSFAENSWDMIMDNNPFNVGNNQRTKRANSSIAEFLAGADVKIGKGRTPKGKKFVKEDKE